MTRFLHYCAFSAALLAPVGAFAQSLDCPDVATTFSMDGSAPSPVSLEQLAEQVGGAELDGKSLHAVSENLHADYPKASDSEIADVMITAYCRFLNKDTPESHRTEADVHAFEQQVYDAVFGGAPPPGYKKQGWLYGN